MSIWLVFLLGVFAGWLIEWIIDWLYWRRNAEQLYATDAELRRQLVQAQTELAAAKTSRAELNKLQAQLNAANTELASVKQRRAALEQAMNDARAELNATRAPSLTQPLPLPAVDAEAVDLTAMRQSLESLRFERDALQDELNKARFAAGGPSFVRRDDLEQIDGIGPVYEQRLFDAGIDTFAQLAGATPDEVAIAIEDQEIRELKIEAWIEQARLYAEIARRDLMPHRLEEIKGIGPIYAKRLRAANIKSFADLASTSPALLESVLGKGRPADYADWIEQAQMLARISGSDRPPAVLEQIKGIGPAMAARLELAGVTDFDDLLQLSEAQLQEIVGVEAWPLVNYQRWMAQARQLTRQSPASS